MEDDLIHWPVLWLPMMLARLGKARLFTFPMGVKSVITHPAAGMTMKGKGFYQVSGAAVATFAFSIMPVPLKATCQLLMECGSHFR